MSDFNIDAIIDKLLEVRSNKPGKPVNLAESEIKELCYRSREIFISQPILLELEAPIKVCGKSHTPNLPALFGTLPNPNVCRRCARPVLRLAAPL